MSKIYNLVAVWPNENGELMATKVAEGPAHQLRVELALCPKGTLRIAVLEAKTFAELGRSEQNISKNKGL